MVNKTNNNNLNKKLILFFLFSIFLFSFVSAFEWCEWIPFWNCQDDVSGNTIRHHDKWILSYTDGIQKEYFDTTIEDLDNGKAKVCLLPKTDLRINDDIIRQSRAILRKNNIQTRIVEPSDMEIEIEGGKVKKMCTDVDFITEDYIRFGNNSTVVEYVDDNLEIKDENDTVIQDITLLENTDQCLINCYSKGHTVIYQDAKLFDGFDFVDRNNNTVNLTIADIYLEELTYEVVNVTDYTYNCTNETIHIIEGLNETIETCEKILNCSNVTIGEPGNETIEEQCYYLIDGYHNETVTHSNYEPYNFSTLTAGSYNWMIKASKNKPIDIDWAVSLQGFETNTIRQYWAWWDNNWTYKRELSNLTGEYPTINLSHETGKMKADFSDLRFLNSTETGELNFTIRSKSNSNWAYITIDTNNESSIYMYYNNNGASFTNSTLDTFHNPVSYYTFDDANKIGSTVGQEDITGNGYPASTIGSAFSNGNGSTGVIGESYYFDEDINSKITVTNLPIDNDGYSVVFWGKMTNENFQFPFWRGANSGTADSTFLEWRNTVGNIHWWSGQYGNDLIFIGADSYNPTNVFEHYLDKRQDDAVCKLYLNNELIGTSTTHGGLSIPSNQFIIGSGAGARPFNGSLDEMILYGREISTDLLNELYSMSDQTDTFVLGNEEKEGQISINLITPADNYNSTNPSLFLQCNCITSGGDNCTTVNMTINDIVVNSTGGIGNQTLNYTSTFSDGYYNWTCLGYGNDSNATTDTRHFTIDTLPPIINITSPANNSIIYQYNETIDLNWTITDDNLDKCWYELEDLCYQESTNTSNQGGKDGHCGLNYNGNYSVFDNRIVNENLLYDGDWNTGDKTNNSLIETWYYVTYYKPSTGFKNATIKTKYSNISINYTTDLPTSCFEDNPNYIKIRYHILGSPSSSHELSCYNGSWNLIDTFDSGDPTFYEEGIFWYNDSTNSEKHFVNCSSNHTKLNYPTSNPNNLIINLFANDTGGNENYSSVTIYKNNQSPVISLDSPLSSYSTLDENQSIDLNFSISNLTILDKCWYDYNNINTTINCSENTSFPYSKEVNNLTFYANDTLGNLGSTLRSWTILFSELNKSFNESLYVTQQNDLVVSFTTSTSIISNPKLYYNGTQYPAILTINGSIFILNSTVPLTDSWVGNNSFYWNVTLDGTEFSTLTYHQNVSDINFSICDSINNVTYLSVNFWDELQLVYINATIRSADFVYYFEDPSSAKTYHYGSAENKSHYDFCFSPSDKNVTVVSAISYYGTDYPERSSSDTLDLTNQSTNITLNLLSDTAGLYATFQFIDSITKTALDSVRVRIYDGNTLVIDKLTGSNGIISEWLNPNILYRIESSKSGYSDNTPSIRPVSTDTYFISLESEIFTEFPELLNGILLEVYPTIRDLDSNTSYGFGFYTKSGEQEIDQMTMKLYDDDYNLMYSASLPNEGNMTLEYINTSNNQTFTGVYEVYGVNDSYYTFQVTFVIASFKQGDYSLDKWGMSLDEYFPASERTTLTHFVWFMIWFVLMLGGFTFGYNSGSLMPGRKGETIRESSGNSTLGFIFAFIITLAFTYFNLIPVTIFSIIENPIFDVSFLIQNFMAIIILMILIWDILGIGSKQARTMN